jgi:hypothetical protein
MDDPKSAVLERCPGARAELRTAAAATDSRVETWLVIDDEHGGHLRPLGHHHTEQGAWADALAALLAPHRRGGATP